MCVDVETKALQVGGGNGGGLLFVAGEFGGAVDLSVGFFEGG